MVYFLFYKVGTDGADDAVNNSSSHPQKYGYSKRVILYYTATTVCIVQLRWNKLSYLLTPGFYAVVWFGLLCHIKPFGTDTANIFFYKDTKL